ncbi:hypothetical protein QLX67_11175 [Balneolaceae bacterium ANBcel3]|nr:hypothetical protein [Balneolaceae bacterium ANBcel3]
MIKTKLNATYSGLAALVTQNGQVTTDATSADYLNSPNIDHSI